MPAGGAGFPKSRRLLRAQEFRTVLSRARRLRSPMFTAAFDPNGRNHPRLGITVSRRVSSRATERNRIKRIVRETFRALQHRLPAVDLVIQASNAAASESEAGVLRRDLERLLGRISIERANAGPVC